MELRHLRYFVAVAESGSVSRAAQKLFIAQPPLSAQIRQLEVEIGAPLFVRLPRGVRLTAAGERLLPEARAILDRVGEVAARARSAIPAAATPVRLALVPSATLSCLGPFLAHLRARTPQARVDVREMITAQQVRALAEGEIDLGIARPLERPPGVTILAAIDDPYCLALPPNHALARANGRLDLRAAAREPFVEFARHADPAYSDRVAALCLDAGFTPARRHEAGHFAGVLAMVARGLGVAIVPLSTALASAEHIGIRALRAPKLSAKLAVIAANRPEISRGTPDAGAALGAAVQTVSDVRTNLLRRAR
jgi:DNA-binding transcriptional LysR family regulator